MNRNKTVFIIAISLFVVVVIITMITERTTREFVSKWGQSKIKMSWCLNFTLTPFTLLQPLFGGY